jgi:serine O-acetyltransferase
MKSRELMFLIKSDLYRYTGNIRFSILIKNLLTNKGFKICFLYRVCNFFYLNKKSFLLFLFNLLFRHCKNTYSIDLSYETTIGSGLYLGHLLGTVISPKSIIGKNINIMQNTTIGYASRGTQKGYPIIGDNVYIGAGAVIIGNIKIGNNAIIGANCVVTKDVPDKAVVVGVPGKVISYNGSDEYVIRIDYEELKNI